MLSSNCKSPNRNVTGAGEENRTPVYSLEGCGSTIKLHLHQVGIFNYTYFLFIVNTYVNILLKVVKIYSFISLYTYVYGCI